MCACLVVSTLQPHRLYAARVTREVPEHSRGQPTLSPGDLLDPGVEPGSPALQGGSLPAELPGKPNSLRVK